MTMKKYFWISIFMAFFTIGTTAHAQTTNLGSNSSTNTSTVATSGLQNEQNFITNNPGTVQYKGGFKTVPSAVLGAFSNSFSTDYCDGTAQIGASFLGGGVSSGKPVLDQGCQLMRTSDMEMRIGVEWRAEANAAFNQANKLEHDEAAKAHESTVVSKRVPHENLTVLTITPKVDPHATETQQLIVNTRNLAYTKELKADMIEQAAAYNLCKIGDKERDSLEEAGFKCPAEKK